MASYKHFQSDNMKYDYKETRTNIFNPEFNPTVSARGKMEEDSFLKNLNKWVDFISWARWYPDLFFDLITPETGGIRLDLDQRVFLRAVARFVSVYSVFPRGYGKCVSGDTLIFTDEGIKEIGEYFNYLKIKKEFYIFNNINLLNGTGGLEKSTKGIYSGYLPTKIITTEEGYRLEGTYNHPILVMQENGQIVFKKIEEIKIGDYVAISRNNNIWGNKTNIDYKQKIEEWLKTLSKQSYSHLMIRDLPNHIDENIALVLGYLIGDGCLTLENRIMFSNKDKDIINNYISIMKNKFNVEVIKCKGDNCDYNIYDKYLRKYFEFLGLENVNSFDKRVPKIIMSSPKNIVAKFLQGLFDTDGTVNNVSVSLCTTSEKMAHEVQILLLNFGIITRKVKRYSKNSFHYLIYIYGENIDKFYNEIGFGCKRKQNKLLQIINIKHNTNKDIIPYQKNNIQKFYNDVKNYNTYVYDNIYHVLKGNNQLTYEKLRYLLQLNNSDLCTGFNILKEYLYNNYYFSKVETIQNSRNHVYDLQTEETHSFVSNGFVSHNTFLEVLAQYHTAIFFPDVFLTMTAQTRENAAKLLKEKHTEILKYYPLLANEVVKANFSKDSAEIIFTSGGRIDIMANSHSSKGARRHRIAVEEAAQINDELFQDALQPIVTVPRRTIGKEGLVNPEEMNGQICFYTTSWYRGSSEYERNLRMVDSMANLEGVLVLGADWQLACHYGRGETRSQILNKKATMSPIAFALNYGSRWVGASDNQLVDINKLLSLRTLTKHENKPDSKGEYYLGVDVARSIDSSNNQSSVVVAKVIRNTKGKITNIMIPNIFTISNALSFSAQAIEVKKIKKLFNAKVVIVDSNGLGAGLVDELMKESFDPQTGESLGCWDTINTEAQPEISDAEKCLFDLKPQSANSEIIVAFMDMVESGKLRLLEKRNDTDYDINDRDNYIKNILPYIHTDFLVEEIANLKLKHLPSGKVSIEKVIKKYNKDRFSALAYVLWYIKNFEDNVVQQEQDELETLLKYSYL